MTVENKLRLIDHTIESILKKQKLNAQSREILPVLGKYCVTAVDLSADSAADFPADMAGLRIRVETEPFREQTERRERAEQQKRPDKRAPYGGIIRWRHGEDLSVLKNSLKVKASEYNRLYLKLLNAPDVRAEEWEDYACLMKEYGLKGLLYCDGESLLDPLRTCEALKFLRAKIPGGLEFCAGNGLGLATANSLAAVSCGIYKIHTIVGGANLSEAAAMEEVLMACKYFKLAQINPSTEKLAKDCRKIMGYLNLKVPVDKAIIGSGVFAHESGIHVDGVIKNPQLYEVIRPEEVGTKRKIVIGKHSGKAAVRLRYRQMGIELAEEELTELMRLIKQTAIKQNAALSCKQLNNLYMAEFGKYKPVKQSIPESMGGGLQDVGTKF